jgi:hypothetical protein
MRRVAQRPHTDVLEYTFAEPCREADAVVCVKLAQRTMEARRALGPHLTVVEAATCIRATDDLLKQFSSTHPQTFLAMLDPEHCGRALEMLEKLARLRKAVESGMTEAEANVHANRLIMEKAMRNPTDAEKDKLVFNEVPPAPPPSLHFPSLVAAMAAEDTPPPLDEEKLGCPLPFCSPSVEAQCEKRDSVKCALGSVAVVAPGPL